MINKLKWKFVLLIFSLVLLKFLTSSSDIIPTAQLVENISEQTVWDLQNISSIGDGNYWRIVNSPALGEHSVLELASSHNSELVYQINSFKDADSITYRVQFLSTQGDGQIKIVAYDSDKNKLEEYSRIFSGVFEPSSKKHKWDDLRQYNNYGGKWHEETFNFADFFTKKTIDNATNYKLSIKVGHGQHALVTDLRFIETEKKSAFKAIRTLELIKGQEKAVTYTIVNRSNKVMDKASLDFIEPYGFGVSCEPAKIILEDIKPQEKRAVTINIKANRANSINMDKPWLVKTLLNGVDVDTIRVYVKDEDPGAIYYIMTEDLEPIDSAGYSKQWGNRNGWLDSEEFKVQLVEKAERLNQIADKYGAKWTHYIAWPAVRAAEWAGKQSSNTAWRETVELIKLSVTNQSMRGHEYALHLHLDYDPYVANNILSYNKQTNGFWANHLKHGWAHNVKEYGTYDDISSRVGSLYYYKTALDNLAQDSPLGQIITARVGSFDFGSGTDDETKSIKAYKQLGLWGSSDADGNEGGITAGEYGQETYFTAPDDINKPAESLDNIGIVEFKPTPKQFIMYDNQSAEELNKLTSQGIEIYSENDRVKAGVHGIIGFTHAMFILGKDDWKSLDGGQFAQIEAHLEYLKTMYVDVGKLKFATATEYIKAWLDYNTPKPIALYGKKLKEEPSYVDYEITILGKDIPAAKKYTHQIDVKYPLYLRNSAYMLEVLKDNRTISHSFETLTNNNDIVFIYDDKNANYVLRVHKNELFAKIKELLP